MVKTREQIERDARIYQISTMVAGNFELQEVLDRLSEAAVKATNTTACSIRLLDDEAGQLQMRSTYGLSEEYRNKGPVTKDDPVVKAAFKGQAVVLDDMRKDPRVRYRDEILREGLISQLTVAMTFRDKPIGVLRLYSPEPNRFDEDAISLARLVATQCAVAITNAKLYSRALGAARMNEQMRLAALIQRRMIPEKAPSIFGLDIAAIYQPCFEVGGDMYDFIRLDDHNIVVAIADVIGKGIPAAIIMSMFRGTLRAYADGGYVRHSFEEIVRKLNAVACRECRNGEFITLFIARIDTMQKTMTYCNCGHEPALLVRGKKTVKLTELNRGGLVLGILEDTQYQCETIPLLHDDCLLMYTDGLIDAMNFEGQVWGRQKLIDALRQCMCDSANCLVHAILRYRSRFVGLASQIDDTSLLAVRFDTDAPVSPAGDDRDKTPDKT